MKTLCFGGMILAGLCAFGSGPGRAQAGYELTANAAGSQSSTVSGVTTETFDSIKAGNYTSLTTAVGTLCSPGLQIAAENQYGGAGGTGHYLAIGAESGQDLAVLTLNGPQAYFGFWWSAADVNNTIGFLSHGQVVAVFDPSTALAALGSAYYGNPNGGGDPGEKFAYLNFIGTAGTTFDQVVFANCNTSTGFESDNWSVRSSALNPNSIPGTVIMPGAVPEPSSLALTASGLLALVGFARARRKA